jgi:hypothetical protein
MVVHDHPVSFFVAMEAQYYDGGFSDVSPLCRVRKRGDESKAITARASPVLQSQRSGIRRKRLLGIWWFQSVHNCLGSILSRFLPEKESLVSSFCIFYQLPFRKSLRDFAFFPQYSRKSHQIKRVKKLCRNWTLCIPEN